MRGREQEWERINNFFKISLAGNSIRSFLILADYGYGKTFILNKIREWLNDDKNQIINEYKTLTAIIVLAETEPMSSISYEYITRIFYSIGNKKIKEIMDSIDVNDLDKFSTNFKLVVKGVQNNLEEAFKWLKGETLTSKERANLDVTSKFHPQQSLTIFMDFLKAMKISGYMNLVVLIDEFEYAVNIYSEGKLTQLFHTFKNIYDKFHNNGGSEVFAKHIQIIAMTPRGWDVVTDLEAKLKHSTGGGGITPWLERMRFEVNKVVLGPINEEAAKLILVDRITEARMKFKEVDYDTFPFIHPSFFELIISVSKGNIRKLLDFSEIVLEEAALNNYKEIDGKIASDILKKFGLITE